MSMRKLVVFGTQAHPHWTIVDIDAIVPDVIFHVQGTDDARLKQDAFGICLRRRLLPFESGVDSIELLPYESFEEAVATLD